MRIRLLSLFVLLTSAAQADLVQSAFIKAGGVEAEFGQSVAISGNTMVVGMPFEDGSGTGVNAPINEDAMNSGAAFVYTRHGASWELQAMLKASNTEVDDFFGSAVGISGDTIVVGATGEDSSATGIDGNQASNDTSSAGAVYVFVRSGATWTQQAYVKASNTLASGVGGLFGWRVAISGETMVVGTQNATVSAPNSGAAYVFRRAGALWVEEAILQPNIVSSLMTFGSSVDVDGDTVVVGARGDSSAAPYGSAYVFVRSGGTWTQQVLLRASEPTVNDSFGTSVSISGETLVVGSPGEDGGSSGINGDEESEALDNSGAAFVFIRNGSSWSQQAYIKAPNPMVDAHFGGSVALDGGTLLIGATGESGGASGINGNYSAPPLSSSGAAYLYHRRGDTWETGAYIKAHHPTEDSIFGRVALDHPIAIVSDSHEDSSGGGINPKPDPYSSNENSGAVYAYDLMLTSLARTGTVAPGAPNLTFGTIGSAAMNDAGEVIWAQTLSGAGSSAGRNKAIYSTLTPGSDQVSLLAQTGVHYSYFFGSVFDGRFTSFAAPFSVNEGNGYFQTFQSGYGINATNNRVLIRSTGISITSDYYQSSASGLAGNNPKVGNIRYTVPIRNENSVIAGVKLRHTAAAPVTTASDSGIIFINDVGLFSNPTGREGQPAFSAGAKFGQFGQMCAPGLLTQQHCFSAIKIPQPSGKPVNALFSTNSDGSTQSEVVAVGDAAPGTSGARFSSITGLTGGLTAPVYKATVKGGGTTAVTNHGLWSGSTLLVRRGDDLSFTTPTGVKIANIVRFWPVNVLLNTQIVLQVTLTGTNVTKANNQALLLLQSDGTKVTLMRTGTAAPGITGGLISKINAVEVNPVSGHYAIIAALKGVPAASNQALFMGHTQLGNNTLQDRPKRLPKLKLRKGEFYTSTRTPGSFIRSLAIKPATDPTGAGGRGLAQAVSANGSAVVYLTSNTGAVELIALRP